jgi:hypothetical protein
LQSISVLDFGRFPWTFLEPRARWNAKWLICRVIYIVKTGVSFRHLLRHRNSASISVETTLQFLLCICFHGWMYGLLMGEVVSNLCTWATNWALCAPHNLGFIKHESQIYRSFLQIAQKSHPTSPHIRSHSVSVYQKPELLGLPELGTRI